MADASKMKLPHRAEHIGSLLRPRELRDAFKAHAAGRMNGAAYREVEDRNIIAAVRMQEQAGLATISDGEFRRGSWAFGLVKAVDGFGDLYIADFMNNRVLEVPAGGGAAIAIGPTAAAGYYNLGLALRLAEQQFCGEIGRGSLVGVTHGAHPPADARA